ncbi:hypothetical protein WR25_26515 isoform B [Diploscapter pachys]|uniref:Uncharacterized protein n=1 Tax=Diploscapter pachys TaxID=2018661 RepID=A0A2A2LIK8_9BILA|nr:hypothetical protein WR25_26515 isoform B [Diploscapter pachys]
MFQVFSLVFDTSKTPEVRFEEIRKLIPEEVQSKEDFEKKKAIIIGFMGKIDQLANYYTTEVAPTLTDNAKAVIKVYTDYIQQPQQFFKDGKDEMKKKFMDAADKIGEKDALDLFIAAGLMANKAKQIKMMDILDKMKAEKDKNFF